MRMRLPSLALAALLCGTLLLASCGDDDSDKDTADGGEPGTPLSDEEYLKVFCEGTTAYQDAILTKPKADEIADVIKDYVKAMKAVTPPADLEPFHEQYVQYLEDAVKDPTSLLTRTPPKPADTPRDRLASKVSDVKECKYPTFLSEKR